METQKINSNSSNSICHNSSSSQNAQHSTPVTPVNNCQGNLFTPYGPQGPQSQFAGYISPIPNQQQSNIAENNSNFDWAVDQIDLEAIEKYGFSIEIIHKIRTPQRTLW